MYLPLSLLRTGTWLVGTEDALRPTPWITLTHTHSPHCHFPCQPVLGVPGVPNGVLVGPSLENGSRPSHWRCPPPTSGPQWSGSPKVHRSFFPSRPVLLTQLPYSPVFVSIPIRNPSLPPPRLRQQRPWSTTCPRQSLRPLRRRRTRFRRPPGAPPIAPSLTLPQQPIPA